ncbi:MAG: hypothetical protein AAF514_14640, partial [Verrucomicrobiota bacterium]
VVLEPGGMDVSGIDERTVSPTETTAYQVVATNAFGTSASQVLVTVLSGPVPTHRYDASHPENTELAWVDGVGNKNLNLNGAILEDSLSPPSANTSFKAAYSTGGGLAGGTAGSFQYQEFTAEIWLRPGELTADHEVLFESGGGQNGIAAMVTKDHFRFLGSAADSRTLDLTVPTTGLLFDDFVQLVFSTSAGTDVFKVSVRDAFGNEQTASATADLIIGGNGAALFAWGSGGLGGDNNLGGRTEAADVNPEGLTGFAGEIALVNLYNRILSSSEIEESFDAVVTVGDPPPPFGIRQLSRNGVDNTLTLTWDSVSGTTYAAQFSTNLEEWFDLAGPFSATSDSTTETINLPPNQQKFFVRIGQVSP